MPSNVQLNAGAGGSLAATIQISHDGDTAQLQGVFLMGASGTEDLYTVAKINGDGTNGLDVDVTRVIPGTTATALGKAEDAAHASGDVGVLALAVRRDAPTVGADLDGDNATINVNASGRVYVTATVDAALPAGTNNIGDVDVLTVPAPLSTSGGGTEATALRVTIANDSTGVVSVDDNGGSLTVDGSVSINGAVDTELTTADLDTGAGTDTRAVVGLALAASGGGLLVGAANPMPVSDNAGSLTVDNAGTFAVQVDGAALTALQLIDNLVLLEDVAHASGDPGILMLAVRRDAAAVGSSTDGDMSTLNVDANGRLHVLDGNSAAMLTALQLIDNPVLVDDAAFTPATSSVKMAGFFADETATDSVDEGDVGAARITLDRKQIIADYVHAAAGGSSGYSTISTAAVLSASIKASAGRVFGIQVFNLNAAARYVRLYNQTTAPATTDGANILWRGIIPGNTAGAGFVVTFPKGMQFSTGIGIRASAAIADTDATALAANELIFNVDYA